jgi:hypothetical protein
VTLRVTDLNDGWSSADDEATWLLGHTQRLSFGPLRRQDGHLYTDAQLGVPCRYLREDGDGVRCGAHGFQGPAMAPPVAPEGVRRLAEDRFLIVDRGRLCEQTLPNETRPSHGALPVLNTPNPCSEAPCRTSDHVRGSACCRDICVEIVCATDDVELEALIRSRKAPYLCKVSRESPDSLEAELISSCGYLEPAQGACTLHGRTRPDGRAAKPNICRDWPEEGDRLHPGCIFSQIVRQTA